MSVVIGEFWPYDFIFSIGGDIYEDAAHLTMDRPLDSGRLLYVKLKMSFLAGVDIEVWFDHFDNTVTAQISRGEDIREVSFYDQSMARSEKIVFIDAIVEGAKDMFREYATP